MIILGQDEEIAQWAQSQIEHISTFGPSAAIGFSLDGEIKAAAVYHNYRHPNIEMSVVITDSRAATRKAIKASLAYPFLYIGVQRITLLTAKGNRKARSLATRIGFKLEGKLRDALPNNESIIIYGMTMNDYRKSKWFMENFNG